MSKDIVIGFTGTLMLLLIPLTEAFPQYDEEHSVRLMFYNVENLFDIYDDTTTDDNEFLPGGVRRWNLKRYENKINSLCKTILAAGEWSPPAIVAFCEVENRKVLKDLVFGTNLSKFNYDILHADSPDPRGIDVCMIFRKELIEIISFRYFNSPGSKENPVPTRSILYTKCKIGGDTIHFFVNHWPSRRGGVLAGEALREDIAMWLRRAVDSIAYSTNAKQGIIIMGDLNATPGDKVVRLLTDSYGSGVSMINLSAGKVTNKGTYRYRGTWEMIDQMIISDCLINSGRGVYTSRGMFRIFDPDFLLKKDSSYPGMSPYSTWAGYRYQGGYSDHLPILLDLMIR